jgi:hypothetical protein
MSEAKEKYYNRHNDIHESEKFHANKYIKELENHIENLIKFIINNNHKYDLLFNESLIELLLDITGKPIEEILQEYEK